MRLKLNFIVLFRLTVRLMELDDAQTDTLGKENKRKSCNYARRKGQDVFIISFISESRTNRAVFCEIVLERLPRPL